MFKICFEYNVFFETYNFFTFFVSLICPFSEYISYSGERGDLLML